MALSIIAPQEVRAATIAAGGTGGKYRSDKTILAVAGGWRMPQCQTGTRGVANADGLAGPRAADHDHRLAAEAALVRRQPAGPAVLTRHDRRCLSRAIYRRGRKLSVRPGARRARSSHRRRRALRLRRGRPLVVRLCGRAPRRLARR